jgi:exodeoxyribonuclease VII large subunit
MAANLRAAQWRVGELGNRLEQVGPAFVIARFRARLGDAQQRLMRGGSRRLLRSTEQVARLDAGLVRVDPRNRVRLLRENLRTTACRLDCAMAVLHEKRRQRVEGLARFLHAVGPEQVLRRGYSITSRKKDGTIVKSAGQVRAGDRLVTRFADGQVESTADDPRQPRLFE